MKNVRSEGLPDGVMQQLIVNQVRIFLRPTPVNDPLSIIIHVIKVIIRPSFPSVFTGRPGRAHFLFLFFLDNPAVAIESFLAADDVQFLAVGQRHGIGQHLFAHIEAAHGGEEFKIMQELLLLIAP